MTIRIEEESERYQLLLAENATTISLPSLTIDDHIFDMTNISHLQVSTMLQIRLLTAHRNEMRSIRENPILPEKVVPHPLDFCSFAKFQTFTMKLLHLAN